MNMIRNLKILAVLGILTAGIISCSKDNVAGPTEEPKPEVKEVKLPSASRISDMALIYHGGSQRIANNNEQMKPYVFRDNGGKPEFLFDSFLFLEITTTLNGQLYDFGVEVPYAKVPGKAEWIWLLDQTFAEGRGPDAIEHTIDSLVQKGYAPPTKRKVVFSIPNPIYGNKSWGMIDNKAMDMSKLEDRFKAARWYVEQVQERWKKKNYKYIELEGYYWVHETIDSHNQDDVLIKQVSDLVKSEKKDFVWIPYNWAEGAERWKEMGFTRAYQQPNYFFDLKSELWILQRGIDFAKEKGLQLEFEFDDRVSEEGYRKHFYDYVEKFEESGVWDNQEVAYYEGGGAWYRMSISKKTEMMKMAKTLGDIIVERQKRLK
ncbi:MAG: DUF4855 domain-containing protein [Sphingobacterium sp.]